MEKLRSTFHSLHDYLNFYGEKKMTGYLPFTHDRAMTTITAMYSLIHKFCGNTKKPPKYLGGLGQGVFSEAF